MGCCNSTSESNEEVLKPGSAGRAKAEADLPMAANGSTETPFDVTLHLKPGEPYLFLRVVELLAVHSNVAWTQVETADLRVLATGVIRYPAACCKLGVVSGERVVPRFLAQMAKLYPLHPEDVYLCESLVEQVSDMWKTLSRDKHGDLMRVQAELLHPIAARLKEAYFVGGQPSLADVFVFFFLEDCYLSKGQAALVPDRLQVFHSAFQSSALYQPLATF